MTSRYPTDFTTDISDVSSGLSPLESDPAWTRTLYPTSIPKRIDAAHFACQLPDGRRSQPGRKLFLPVRQQLDALVDSHLQHFSVICIAERRDAVIGDPHTDERHPGRSRERKIDGRVPLALVWPACRRRLNSGPETSQRNGYARPTGFVRPAARDTRRAPVALPLAVHAHPEPRAPASGSRPAPRSRLSHLLTASSFVASQKQQLLVAI